MRLRDVLEQPGARLPVLTGEADLDRPLKAAFTTDLLDPGRYLTGGEMVLTGLMWRREPADSELFVSSLAKAGIAALGAGEGLAGPVPDDLIDACRRHRVPLFAVPADVSFRAITDRITTVLWSEREVGARSRQRGLMSALADGADLAEVWPDGSWVVTATGRLVAGTPLRDAPRVAAAFLAAAVLPARCRIAGVDHHLDRLPGGARFVVCADPADLDELVPLAALDLAREERARQVERRLAARLVETLVAEEPPSAALAACGLAAAGTHLVLVASVEAAMLDELVHPAEAAVAATAGGSVAVVPVDDPVAFLAALRDRAGHLAIAAPLAIGVSEPSSAPGGLAGALTEAGHAHAYALERPGRARVVSCAELASHDLLLAALPASTRRAFAERLLAPLAAYDATHRADLLRTLEAFLACDGSWTRCAALLHVHVNTLRYRVKRISDLTGRDLDAFTDRVDFHLALRLRA
ncbi:PucR family transcriptional regulator [Actinocorallia longicatena]|uniref:PucR family transcriptional regulator n=1 Tax=Actinocorallia longicatena TaxID=111803 RepID=A0ABP6QGJ5_9ACTN